MRIGIKAKQIAAVTAIVGMAVVALSIVHVARLARVVLRESQAQGQLFANTVFHRARAVVVATSAQPYDALRSDEGLRSILEASVFGESVTDAAIVDTAGSVQVASDRSQEGRPSPTRDDVDSLLSRSVLDQLSVIYSRDGQTLEVRQPMLLGDEAFGSIRIGVSTVLVRRELDSSLRPTINIAVIFLAIAIVVSGVLAQLLLRPINVLRSGLTRLGKGEFGVTLDLPQDDEFGELGSFFNTISQQLSADRSLLAGQKANLQSAVEHLEDAVALFNPQGELLFSNPAMQPRLRADATGRALAGLLAEGDPYRTLVEETLAMRVSRGPVQLGVDVLLMTHAIAATDGQLLGVLLVSRNLSYLSRMQSTLAYSRKLVALGRLTAGIAHEVKNPLNAMMIHLELLRTKIRQSMVREPVPVGAGATAAAGLAQASAADVAGAGALQHVGVIESEIRRLDEVVQGFLKFARPEDLRLQPVKLRTIVDEVLPVVESEASAHGVRIEVSVSAALPAVNGDSTMLRQVFLNLCINACQAMPQGGTLRLSAAVASRDQVEVTFEDTGTGIPADHLSKIFDLYFTTKDHGTGIGLSMVYRIVQLHDGEIEVQSTPGHGTTFRVLLPQSHDV